MERNRGKERITISCSDNMLGNREMKEKIQKGIEESSKSKHNNNQHAIKHSARDTKDNEFMDYNIF